MSDNGASQEGGTVRHGQRHGPLQPASASRSTEKLARIDDIGGPDTHSNFPLGWAMAANTPLRRYKQNTHGGGIRDPLVHGLAARASPRAASCATSSATPATSRRPCSTSSASSRPRRSTASTQMPIEGTSFAASLRNAAKAPSQGEAAVLRDVRPSRPVAGRLEGRVLPSAGHAFDHDKWELYHLDRDFNEIDDLAEREPERLKAMIDAWWQRGRGAPGAAARRPLRGRASPTTPSASTGRASSSCSTPAWAICRPTWRRTCAAAATRSRPMPASRAGDRGRADRARRHDLRLQPLHQGQPPRATT